MANYEYNNYLLSLKNYFYLNNIYNINENYYFEHIWGIKIENNEFYYVN